MVQSKPPTGTLEDNKPNESAAQSNGGVNSHSASSSINETTSIETNTEHKSNLFFGWKSNPCLPLFLTKTRGGTLFQDFSVSHYFSSTHHSDFWISLPTGKFRKTTK